MIPRSVKSSPASRTGATLIELVAGLALLALLGTALLMTRARLIHQRAEAESRLRAVAAADELLSAWHQGADSIPRQSAGTCFEPSFTWTTKPIASSAAASLHAEVIRLEILKDSRPATSIDVVLHVEESPTTSP